ncbi:Rieske (2Fe-2S) protein [Streptomyces sp. NPDC090025]|uniref:Rieske (2Fe-2S) protein n=1 Tax=Streptomyces sp. NPDC090025 TaxID=3365922 RepID=UPI0038327E36
MTAAASADAPPATVPPLAALSRRSTLLASLVLAAGCGSGSGSDSGTSSSPSPSSPGTASASASALARTEDIPVGGGKVFTDRKVVVTQPKEGEFKAFSAVCTHQGCLVDKVADGTIDCPCHGSRYRIADGSVAAGPAPRPLPAERINVSAGEITLT